MKAQSIYSLEENGESLCGWEETKVVILEVTLNLVKTVCPRVCPVSIWFEFIYCCCCHLNSNGLVV